MWPTYNSVLRYGLVRWGAGELFHVHIYKMFRHVHHETGNRLSGLRSYRIKLIRSKGPATKTDRFPARSTLSFYVHSFYT